MLDPYLALAAAAAATTTIQLGTGVALIAQQNPITLAKEIATLDHLSQGRFHLGIGFGWNREEMANHSVAFNTRREQVAEHLSAMRSIWSNDVASFEGDFVRFDGLWSWPKCSSPKGPPVLIGGAAGPKMFRAIASYADGWMPVGGAGLGHQLDQLRQELERVGRDPTTLRVVPFGSLPNPEKLDYFQSLGVTETVLRLPSSSADEVLRSLDAFSEFIPQD